MDYKKLLDDSFELSKGVNNIETKLEYIGDCIFDFTTYDSAATELFTTLMLGVLNALVTRTLSDYQESPERYLTYLIAVNSPFLKDKIEWGTSIRGAWLIEYEGKEYHLYDNLIVPQKDICKFISTLIEWAKISINENT